MPEELYKFVGTLVVSVLGAWVTLHRRLENISARMKSAEDEIKDFKTGDYRVKYKQTIREILRVTTLNIMPERFYNEVFIKGHSTAKDVEMESARAKRQKDKLPLSFSEAAELQAKMQAFGDFLKDKEREKGA